jgi:hypothetical protein
MCFSDPIDLPPDKPDDLLELILMNLATSHPRLTEE